MRTAIISILPISKVHLNSLLTACLFGTLSLLFVSSAKAQTNEFWQDPFSSDSYHFADSSAGRLEMQQGNLRQGGAEQWSFRAQKDVTQDQTFVFKYSQAVEESNTILGYTHDRFSVSALSGSSRDRHYLTDQYQGIDPYLFHIGIAHDFRYQGYALDTRIGRHHHVQFGQVKLLADGLESRRARYFEWSDQTRFARVSHFSRGAESVGYGFDAGVSFGRNQIEWQSMQLDSDRSLQRVRWQFNGQANKQYWFDVSQHKNALYRENDDYRVMLSFKTLLGKKPLVSSHNIESTQDQTPQDEKPSKSRRGLYIGAGVVAAAALSSSGSSSSDSVMRFASAHEAAFGVLNRINPRSVRENREYGGYIYQANDGSFASTDAVRGEPASVTLPPLAFVLPAGAFGDATYHTHAGFDPRFDNENFSPTDIQGDIALELNGYLGTPAGQIKFHNYRTGEITTLGRINN